MYTYNLQPKLTLTKCMSRYHCRRVYRLPIRSSLFEGEFNQEAFLNKYKSNLSRSLQECIITPKVFKKTMNKYWINISDVSLSVFLKDNQYYLDINMREDVDEEMKDEIYHKETFDNSIDEVLFQLNKWQIGQYAINAIDTFGLLMDVDKTKTVSIPLSIYVSRLEEFDLIKE